MWDEESMCLYVVDEDVTFENLVIFLNVFVEILEPEVNFTSLSIISPGRDDIVLPIPEDGKPHGLWFTLKEGSPYRLKFSLVVSNNIVSGLKYTNTVWKTAVKGMLNLIHLV